MLDETHEKVQELTMDAIGDELMVSRSSVSRLLQMVRDRSIIKVKLHSPEDATRRMIVEIKKRHGLKAHLVPVPESASPIERFNRVALTAARMLTNFFLRWNDHGRCPGISRKRSVGTQLLGN